MHLEKKSSAAAVSTLVKRVADTASPVPPCIDSHPSGQSRSVAILLCTFQGERFLTEQLASFAAQRYRNWTVWASDDGSTDGTAAILDTFRVRWGDARLSLQSGPAAGFVANFLSLTANPVVRADYYAYSDQDDLWESDKLERAVAWLDTVPADTPALYCGRTLLVDESNCDIGFSPLFCRAPCFSNALVQSIAGGNTMVFNQAARQLIGTATPDIGVVSHDWWAYLVVSGCGGQVFYDAVPTTRYRQHGDNLVGSNNDWGSRIMRARWLIKGRFRSYSELNLRAMEPIRRRLTAQNRAILEDFTAARTAGFVERVARFWRARIYRQTWLGNIGLIVAVLLKKI